MFAYGYVRMNIGIYFVNLSSLKYIENIWFDPLGEMI